MRISGGMREVAVIAHTERKGERGVVTDAQTRGWRGRCNHHRGYCTVDQRASFGGPCVTPGDVGESQAESESSDNQGFLRDGILVGGVFKLRDSESHSGFSHSRCLRLDMVNILSVFLRYLLARFLHCSCVISKLACDSDRFDVCYAQHSLMF